MKSQQTKPTNPSSPSSDLSGSSGVKLSTNQVVVTIDGPAASGKSSVSRELAKRFGWSWVSTGAFYRGLAYAAIHSVLDSSVETNVGLGDVAGLVKLCSSPIWEVRMTPQKTLVYFEGQDVTSEIGQEDVGLMASQVSRFPQVRASLLAAQRNCVKFAQGGGLLAEGRDCGTVVFPEARAKIFLTASRENRAQRRIHELGGDQDSMLEAQKVRDLQDSTRKVAPLQIPENAMVIDTTALSLDEVVQQAESFIRSQIV